jgi:dihydrodipicolinate synthase/N-acetylneuraminate lyase
MSGLRAHFQALLKEGPAIIYNVPGRTGQDIPDALVQEMAQHPNFLGMKECTGNKRIGNYTSQVCWSVCFVHCSIGDDACRRHAHSWVHSAQASPRTCESASNMFA